MIRPNSKSPICVNDEGLEVDLTCEDHINLPPLSLSIAWKVRGVIAICQTQRNRLKAMMQESLSHRPEVGAAHAKLSTKWSIRIFSPSCFFIYINANNARQMSSFVVKHLPNFMDGCTIYICCHPGRRMNRRKHNSPQILELGNDLTSSSTGSAINNAVEEVSSNPNGSTSPLPTMLK